jgi:hypothetical protein
LKQAVEEADGPAIVEAATKLHNDDPPYGDSEEAAEGSSTRGRAPQAPMGSGSRISLGLMNEEEEVGALLKHRWADDDTIELLVKWVDGTEETATWEPEVELQRGAAESVYEYWKKQGGRSEVLFYKQEDPDHPAMYHVFDIISHQKKQPGGFLLEVQWVGYPKTKDHTSFEPEARLKNIAPELLAEYWEKKGGRAKFLAARGRAKKARD